MLHVITSHLISKAEKRLGVPMDHVRAIAAASTNLLNRYRRFFSFLDPNNHAPPEAYYVARIRGAMAADCGTCVETEFNLADQAGVDGKLIAAALRGDLEALGPQLGAVSQLTEAVVANRIDDPDARDAVVAAYGEAGLIEISYAMNGAALLPGIKRAMGYAVACDATLMARLMGTLDGRVSES